MKISLLKETKSFRFHFIHKLITLFHFPQQKKASISSFVFFRKRVQVAYHWQALTLTSDYIHTYINKVNKRLINRLSEFVKLSFRALDLRRSDLSE